MTVDVRIISASSVPLDQLIQKGLFREELYYRLNILRIHIPSLRERREDIPILINHFIREKSLRSKKQPPKIKATALNYLCSLDWPGNVRQLENCIERIIYLAKYENIGIEDVKLLAETSMSIQTTDHETPQNDSQRQIRTLAEIEKQAISDAIQQAGGNISRACSFLNVSRPFLYRRIKKYGIEYATRCDIL